MKTAIDNYAVGKQKETSASDYLQNTSLERGRFTCPECGEDVHIAGSKYSNHFSHYKRVDITAECDRRVDGKSSFTIYERIGLPIYLRQNESRFSLYMGFRGIQERYLSRAVQEQAYIEIIDTTRWGKSKTSKYYINKERFYSDKTSFIPLDFVPDNGHRYEIRFSESNIANSLKEHWADYADGFSNAGALFTSTEQGGKKIRHGDSISINTEYYWVRKNMNISSVEGISMNFCGNMMLNREKFYVFHGTFKTKVSQIDQFERLARYLKNDLHVTLLEQQPGVVPVWPPCVRKGDFYQILAKKKDVISIVKSGNEEPKVFAYRESVTKESSLNILKLTNDVCLTKFAVSQNQMLINVDRKMIGTGVFFQNTGLQCNKLEEQVVRIVDSKAENFKNLHERITVTDLLLQANSKLEIIRIKKDDIESIKVIDKEVLLKDLENKERIFITAHNHLLHDVVVSFEKSKTKVATINDSSLFYMLQRYDKGTMISIPIGIEIIMREIMNNTEKSKALMYKYIENRKMPEATIRFLLQWGKKL